MINTHPRVFLLFAQRDRKLVQVSKSYTYRCTGYMEKRKISHFPYRRCTMRWVKKLVGRKAFEISAGNGSFLTESPRLLFKRVSIINQSQFYIFIRWIKLGLSYKCILDLSNGTEVSVISDSNCVLQFSMRRVHVKSARSSIDTFEFPVGRPVTGLSRMKVREAVPCIVLR